ncbi:MAG: iron-containing alcohol dehydrogenase [Verrucomicrobiota bacterium]|jgi:alcohol dehydrogenase class IV
MRFEFATATRIIFGAGTLREVGPLAREFGPGVLVVTGSDLRRAEPLLALLREQGLGSITCSVRGEPTIEAVPPLVAFAKRINCSVVIAIGGGSALDAGKAIAAMLANPGELLDYLEVIGRGQALTRPSVPFIAIPTTAGTGSEVTRNAVLASPEHHVKVSLRSPLVLPRVAVVDPELTYGLPPASTASTGLDALTQLIEPYVCSRANPMTDALCVEGIRRAARSLRAAFADGRNATARSDMAVASLFGGLALANAGLGAVHGFAGPIGGQFPAPHGAVCAALLPQVMEANLRALRQRQPGADTLRRYEEVAHLVTGNASATAEAGVEWVRKLVADLQIPRLGHYGLKREHTAGLVEKASQASSMKANPIALTRNELAGILERAL